MKRKMDYVFRMLKNFASLEHSGQENPGQETALLQ